MRLISEVGKSVGPGNEKEKDLNIGGGTAPIPKVPKAHPICRVLQVGGSPNLRSLLPT